MRGESQQLRAFGAQFHDARDGGLGIVLVAVVTAALEGLPDTLAEIPATREHQKRINARTGVDDDPFAGKLALVGGCPGAFHQRYRKTGEVLAALEDRPRVFV